MKVKKPIWYVKTTSFVLLAILILLGLSFGFLSLFMPRFVADTSYNLGFYKMSLHYYEKTYENSKNADDLFNFVNASIVAKNDKKIIESYEKFLTSEKYEQILQDIELNLEQENLNIITKSLLINEDNYLKGKYVLALINQGQVQKAQTTGLQYLNVSNLSLKNVGTYAIYNVLNSSKISQNIKQNVLNAQVGNSSLKNVIYSYFNELVDVFNEGYENFESLTNYEKSNLLYVSYRIGQVKQNILLNSSSWEENEVNFVSNEYGNVLSKVNTLSL